MQSKRDLWDFLNTRTDEHYRQEDLNRILREKGLTPQELEPLEEHPLVLENGAKIYFKGRCGNRWYDDRLNEYWMTSLGHLFRKDTIVVVGLSLGGEYISEALVSADELRSLHVCRECGTYYDGEESQHALCHSCRSAVEAVDLPEEQTCMCPLCQRQIPARSGFKMVVGGSEETICPRCLSTIVAHDYAREASSGILARKDSMDKMPSSDIWFSREYVTDSIAQYHSYTGGYVPEGVEGEETKAYFGIEIESKGECVNAAWIRLHAGDVFNCQYDGSVSGGFEAVSQPRSMKWWREYFPKLSEMCSVLTSNGQKAHDATGCGLHVHVSRDAFKDENSIKRAILLVHRFQKQMEWFSRRESGHYYAYQTYSGDPSERVYSSIPKSGHCCAVNNANRNTVEFRVFKSTLKPETILATIELVNSIVEMANSNRPEFSFSSLLLLGKYLPGYVNERRAAAPDLEERISFRSMFPEESAEWDARRLEALELSTGFSQQVSQIEQQIAAQQQLLEQLRIQREQEMALWGITPEELEGGAR